MTQDTRQDAAEELVVALDAALLPRGAWRGARAVRHTSVGDPAKGALVAGEAAGLDLPCESRVVLANFGGDLVDGQTISEAVFAGDPRS